MGKLKADLNGTFKIYPRGFLGSVQSPTVERSATGTSNDAGLVGRLQYDMTLFDANKSKKITANMIIDKHYRDFVRSGSINFNKREQVFIAALNAFGTKNIYQWYCAQFESPSFGETNRTFLDDIFKFIQTGRRALPLTNWNSLVRADETNDGNRQLGTHASSYFGCGTVDNMPIRYTSVQQFLQDWLSREGGFNDMIFSLFILFGVSD